MGLVVDSSVFIVLERSRADLASLRQVSPGESGLALSAVTWAELCHALYRTRTTEQFQRRETYLKLIAAAFEILPFDTAAAQLAGEVGGKEAASGRVLPALDLQIAATALAHGYGVLTANLRDFHRVPGLRVVSFDPAVLR
jgi:predicted nucleic acid-binding protein